MGWFETGQGQLGIAFTLLDTMNEQLKNDKITL